MKTLNHYFTYPVKSEQDSTETKEVINEPVMNNDEKIAENTGKRKRGRVKIKISQTRSRGKVCNIIETKNDLIDKTPSPFAGLTEQAKVLSPDATPKRSNIPKIDKLNKNNNDIDLDSTYENIFNAKSPKKNDLIKNSTTSAREESNAFQLLMTRNKPIKYLTTKELTPEDEILEIQKKEESKAKLKQTKEKIIILADKKGYSKRKLAEKEEDEKMEKILENRAKMFKKNPETDNNIVNTSLNAPKGSTRGLHNYFTTVTAEEREKARLLELSTHIVEAEIHGAKVITTKQTKSTITKTNSKIIRKKTRTVLAAIDDIQVLRSETPSPTPIEPELSKELCQTEHNKKPKWTLRINVLSSDQEDNDTGKFTANSII